MWTLSSWLWGNFVSSNLCQLLVWWLAFLIVLNACGLVTTYLPTCCKVIDPAPTLRALLFVTERIYRNEVVLPCSAAKWRYRRMEGLNQGHRTLVSPVKWPYFGPGQCISSTVPPAFEQLPDATLFSVKPSGSWSGSENCVVARSFFMVSPSSAPLKGSCSTGKGQGNVEAWAQKEGDGYSRCVLSHLKQMVLFLVPDGMTFSSQKPFKFDHTDMLGRMSDEHTSVQDLLPNSNMSTIKLTKGEFTIKAGASAWLAFKERLEKCSCTRHPGQCSFALFHSMKFYILLVAFWNTLK